MKKNDRSIINAETRQAIRIFDRDIRNAAMPAAAEDETLAGRVTRALTVFSALRPLLLALTTLGILPPASRTAVTMFVQALDAVALLTQTGTGDEIADFKPGRDLEVFTVIERRGAHRRHPCVFVGLLRRMKAGA